MQEQKCQGANVQVTASFKVEFCTYLSFGFHMSRNSVQNLLSVSVYGKKVYSFTVAYQNGIRKGYA